MIDTLNFANTYAQKYDTRRQYHEQPTVTLYQLLDVVSYRSEKQFSGRGSVHAFTLHHQSIPERRI